MSLCWNRTNDGHMDTQCGPLSDFRTLLMVGISETLFEKLERPFVRSCSFLKNETGAHTVRFLGKMDHPTLACQIWTRFENDCFALKSRWSRETFGAAPREEPLKECFCGNTIGRIRERPRGGVGLKPWVRLRTGTKRARSRTRALGTSRVSLSLEFGTRNRY